jgi:hypothetical protein
MTENQRIQATTQQIVKMLVDQDYSEIANLTNCHRLNAEQIAEAISEYGCSLIMPPESTFSNLDVIKIESENSSQWSVNVNLWTIEEGESDLTLELTLIENGKEILKTEVDNIQVR